MLRSETTAHGVDGGVILDLDGTTTALSPHEALDLVSELLLGLVDAQFPVDAETRGMVGGMLCNVYELVEEVKRREAR